MLRTLAFLTLGTAIAHAIPLIGPTDTYRYRKGSTAPQANWRTVAESGLDATWLSGPGFFGYGDGTPGTVLSDMRQTTTPANAGYRTFYVRRSFTIPAGLPATERLYIRTDFDDGFVAWIMDNSGTAVAGDWNNAPGLTSVSPAPPNTEPANNTGPSSTREASFGDSSPQPARIQDLGPVSSFPPGDYTLCAMCLNQSLTSSDAVLHTTLYTETPPPPLSLTWTKAESPYTINSTFTVAANAVLTIEPGVVARFASGAGLTINGRILAEGTAAEPITFTRAGTSGTWGRISIDNSSGARQDQRMVHCRIEYPSASSSTVRAQSTNLQLENVRFSNVATQMVDMISSSCRIIDCDFASIADGELIHFSNMPSTGYALIRGCRFGTPGVPATAGYNDIIDFTGGNRPGPIVSFIDNLFYNGGEDVFDMDGTDAHIEGNVFFNIRKDAARASSSNCITTGANGSDLSQLVICRNWFYNVEHAFLEKDSGTAVLQNNTIVQIRPNAVSTNSGEAPGVIMFGEPWRGDPYGDGVIYEGNISTSLEVADPFPLLAAAQADGAFFRTARNCTNGFNVAGTGNLNTNPLLVDVTGVDFNNYRTKLALQPASPCRGTGPNGLDMGADVPAGASIGGGPAGSTTSRDATFTIAGPGIWSYRWRLDGGPWSAEVSLVPQTIRNGAPFTAAMFDSAPPVSLTNLADGPHTLEVEGRNSAGDWQQTPPASRAWTVLPPDTDNDGIPDAWETANGLDPADPADADADADGDTQSNRHEFAAGTDPRNPASRLLAGAASQPDGTIRIAFEAVAGRTYRIDWTNDLSQNSWTELTRTGPAAATGPLSVTDPNPGNAARRFYRVVTPAQ